MLDPINDTYFPLRIIVVLYVLCIETYIVNCIFKLYVFLATRVGSHPNFPPQYSLHSLLLACCSQMAEKSVSDYWRQIQ